MEIGNLNTKSYWRYKQGYWFKKSDDTLDPNYATISFKKFGSEEKELVSGIFTRSIKGKITSIYIFEKATDDGKKFKMLNIELDNEAVLSISFNSSKISNVVRTIIQSLKAIDLEKPVQFVSWTKDGYSKLSIKQEGEHVKNTFFEFVDNKFVPKKGSNYPKKPADATERQITEYHLDEAELAVKVIEEIGDKVNTTKFEAEDVDPNEIDF